MYSEHQLETRDSLILHFTRYLQLKLQEVNPAFHFIRIETPILVPYSVEMRKDESVNINTGLRRNTLKQALEIIKSILNGKIFGKTRRLPIVVWQHGKIFQEYPLRELYSLEYQVLFSKTTGMNYTVVIFQACATILSKLCGPVFQMSTRTGTIEEYSICANSTNDVLVTVRVGEDFWAENNIEVAFDMDRCTAAYLRYENVKMTKTLSITRGLPGSGKTSWAKSQIEKQPDTVRINKDDIRKELGISPGDFKREKEVLQLELSRIQSALQSGVNLIIDNTHNSPRYKEKYEALAKEHGYTFELIDFSHVPLEECLRRDALRPGDLRVGEAIIRQMWENFYRA